ncbi:MAG: hypothetical protein HY298_26015 [Verrucomicrobia bacterium]|nr:hypothetical protein [Verrucomicrobiota bacterium]
MNAALLILIATSALAAADDLASLSADRTAIERVYYEHRLGNKPPFEQTLPPALIEKLVRQDLEKEAVLKKVYGVELARAEIEAEVRRINSTTRAPEMLSEIKKALGDDAERFARSVAKPIVVERELRAHFENDDALHAARRQQAKELRAELLNVANQSRSRRGNEAEAGAPNESASSPRRLQDSPSAATQSLVEKLAAILRDSRAGSFSEVTWQLSARPDRVNAELRTQSPSPLPAKVKASSTAYSVEATAQLAQVLASPENHPRDQKSYFEDLSAELQNVLRVQLQKPGDISAVIETPTGFLLFLAKEKTADALSAASLSISKRSYELWLANQSDDSQTNTASK